VNSIKRKGGKKTGRKALISALIVLVFFLATQFLWPVVWNFVILPKASPDRHGFRIESFKSGLFLPTPAGQSESPSSLISLNRPNHSALAFTVWEVPASGSYRFLLETDASSLFYLDGKTILKTNGFYPHNGEGTVRHLEKGPHFLLFSFDSGPNQGRVRLKIRPPEGNTFSPIDPAFLRYLELNNLPEWWRFYTLFLWIMAGVFCLGLWFLWAPEISAFMRSRFFFDWLTNKNSLVWISLGLIMVLFILGVWPFLKNYFLLPQIKSGRSGLDVEIFAGKIMSENPVKVLNASSSQLTLADPQSSLRASAIWEVAQAGIYTLKLSCIGYGGLTIDDQPVISFPERYIGPGENIQQYLTAGPHLVVLKLFNYDNPGSINFTVGQPNETDDRYLSEKELTRISPKMVASTHNAVLAVQYLGLMLLSLSLLLLALKTKRAASRLSDLLGQDPFGLYLCGFSLTLALALTLRIIFLVDMEYPAEGSKWLAIIGLITSFGLVGRSLWASLSKKNRQEGPATIKPAAEEGLICILAIMSIAVIIRVLFLQNMEFKYDEREMVYMAVNLVWDHIPYVVGNLSSHGNRNPAGFLYLLSIPALISNHPIHITFFITLLNIVAVYMTFRIVSSWLGWRAGAVAALLFSCSPWAVHYSMKIWPQHCIMFFTLSLYFCLRSWYEKGGKINSILLGLSAAMLAQLHFSSFLFLVGIVIFFLILAPNIPWKRLPLVLIAFILLWLPYIYYQMKSGPDSGPIIQQYLREFPGGNLKTIRNVYWETGGFFLDSNEALGTLGKEFRASVRNPIYYSFHIWIALALIGLYVFEFRHPPGHTPRDHIAPDWLKLYIWAVIFALTAQVLLNFPADISYVEFVFPWPFVLMGLGITYLEGKWGSKRIIKTFRFVPVSIVLLISISGTVYFWSWQNFLGRTGGSGDYEWVFYRKAALEYNPIKIQRPLPGPGPETKFSW
jgi:hypothetical protein